MEVVSDVFIESGYCSFSVKQMVSQVKYANIAAVLHQSERTQ